MKKLFVVCFLCMAFLGFAESSILMDRTLNECLEVGLILSLVLNLLCAMAFCCIAWKFCKLKQAVLLNRKDINLWNDPYFVEAWKENEWKNRIHGGK